MANVVLGLATSHAPQLRVPVEQWAIKGVDDRDDPRVGDYDALARQKASWIRAEIASGVMKERHAAIQHSIRRLSDTLARVALSW